MTASADELADAIVAALGTFDELTRDRTAKVDTKSGGSYSYNYADLASVLGYVRPILAKHGLVVLQPVSTSDGAVSVETVLLHRSGLERGFPPLTMPAGRTPQEIGSAITYARRYSLLAALGLATEDDDGKAGQPATVTRRPTSRRGPSQALTARVMAMFGELGITDRDARLSMTSSLLGRSVSSWKDVTAAEASAVSDALDARTAAARASNQQPDLPVTPPTPIHGRPPAT